MEQPPEAQGQAYPEQAPISPKSVRHLVGDQARGVVEDVAPIIRLIVSNFLVHFSFLVAGTLTILTIRWFGNSLIARNIYMFYLMEGLEIFSFIGTAVSFITSVCSDYLTQRKANSAAEKRAGLK